MNKFDDRLYYSFQKAFVKTDKLIATNPQLSEDFKKIHFFAHQVLPECFPSDFESLKKIWLFPILEAGLELEYALLFAKAGVYKVAYMSLRNFMELSLVCFHFLLMAKGKGNEWVKGQISTPFKREILNVLFDNEDFRHFDQHIQVKESINRIYSALSDICHTRGQPCSHMALSKGNFPRCIEESVQAFIARAKDVLDIVITCFVGVNPIILFPLPLDEKFGMNGPMSGFLQEYEVEALRKLLKPESLKALLTYYEADPSVLSIRQYFEDLPDITEEEFKQQIAAFDKFMKEMEERNVQQKHRGDRE